ncbi:unnamed protein product [Amoebophrya sp. A25]|nr:unnamed protein product [Amoebophrya sp. A25]|eukprot:GSA25T00000356001.1
MAMLRAKSDSSANRRDVNKSASIGSAPSAYNEEKPGVSATPSRGTMRNFIRVDSVNMTKTPASASSSTLAAAASHYSPPYVSYNYYPHPAEFDFHMYMLMLGAKNQLQMLNKTFVQRCLHVVGTRVRRLWEYLVDEDGRRAKILQEEQQKVEELEQQADELWQKFGIPLHFLTLAYEDDDLESGFKLDHVRRSKRFVRYTSFLIPLVLVCLSRGRADHHRPLVATTPILSVTPVLFFLHWGIITFTNEVHSHFHGVLFLCSIISMLSFIYLVAFVQPTSLPNYDRDRDQWQNFLGELFPLNTESQIVAFVVLNATTFRLPFVLLMWSTVLFIGLLYAAYVTALGTYAASDLGGWMEMCHCTNHGIELTTREKYSADYAEESTASSLHYINGVLQEHCDLPTTSRCVQQRKRYGNSMWIHFLIPDFPFVICVAILMLILAYLLEVLQRRDYIQSTRVFQEIARNEQLLDNIFPRHIVARIMGARSEDGDLHHLHDIMKNSIVRDPAHQTPTPGDAARLGQRVDGMRPLLQQGGGIRGIPTTGEQGGIRGIPQQGTQTLPQKSISLFADYYNSCSIFFADIVRFTDLSSRTTPEELVKSLNTMFGIWDSYATRNGVVKIKTIGDCYMAAAGLEDQNPEHAKTLCKFGLEVLKKLATGNLKIGDTRGEQHTIQMRLGIHSGSAVAGVIGRVRFSYDVWGEAVHLANRMESEGEPGKLHVSNKTHELIFDDFECEERNLPCFSFPTYFVNTLKPAALDKCFVNDQGPNLAMNTLQSALEFAVTRPMDDDEMANPLEYDLNNASNKDGTERFDLFAPAPSRIDPATGRREWTHRDKVGLLNDMIADFVTELAQNTSGHPRVDGRKSTGMETIKPKRNPTRHVG